MLAQASATLVNRAVARLSQIQTSPRISLKLRFRLPAKPRDTGNHRSAAISEAIDKCRATVPGRLSPTAANAGKENGNTESRFPNGSPPGIRTNKIGSPEISKAIDAMDNTIRIRTLHLARNARMLEGMAVRLIIMNPSWRTYALNSQRRKTPN